MADHGHPRLRLLLLSLLLAAALTTPSSSDDSDFVKRQCAKTRHPDMCGFLVDLSGSHCATQLCLATSTIAAEIDTADEALWNLWNMRDNATKEVTAALVECVNKFHTVKGKFVEVGKMVDAGRYQDALDAVNTAFDIANDCKKGFGPAVGMPPAVQKTIDFFEDTTDVMFDLIVELLIDS